MVQSRYFPELPVLLVIVSLQVAGVMHLVRSGRVRWHSLLMLAAYFSIAIEVIGFLLRYRRVARFFPNWVASWGLGLAMAWGMLSLVILAIIILSRWLSREQSPHHAGRRAFLRFAQVGLVGAPAAALGYGMFIERFQIRLREENIAIPDLPKDLDGLKLVQLTDIHLSPFLSERELEHAVAMANETRAHLALVTGDLISTVGDPLDACIAQLAKLRATAGVYGCLGNHEINAGAEDYTAREAARRGMRFLRREAARLPFGEAHLNLAGVDYQRFRRPYLVGAQKLVDPAAFNILLSHNPDVFPVAAKQGFGLTIAGHTHGGQVRVEILHQDLNVARFFTPYVDGLYRQDSAAIFVSRGIGTIGMPARFGAPPEVALIRLWRT